MHREGILRLTRAPFGNAALTRQAQRAARRLLEHFDYVGVLTIEFFVTRGKLIANEMAPRVHNSGHWTIEGAETSQFENHVRAIAGLPLGSTRARGHSAMINLIGELPAREAILREPGLHWHDYGKSAAPGQETGPHHPGGADTAGSAICARSRYWDGSIARPGSQFGKAISGFLRPRAGFTVISAAAMYIESFKLRELPFRLSPDPQFLFLSRAHARAKAYMESTIWFTDGFVVITGEIGSGKTTLIESFLRQLDSDVVIAQINQTQVTAVEFLQSVLVQFGFSPFKMKKAELIATINSFLIEQYAAGRKVLLIVDEAQNLSLKVLEEIRLLSGIESTKEKVLRIILAGQPELNEKLDSPELVQLMQRVRLRFHLGALSRDDLRAYVLHRLEVAGANGREIFAEDTFPEIARYSGGVPRLVNTLCDTAMMAAFNEDRDHVTAQRTSPRRCAELQWVEFSARASTLAAPPGRPKPPPGERLHAARAIARWCCPPMARRMAELHLVPGSQGHRPHAGQRSADRQQIHQPPPLPAHHRQRRRQRDRRSQQHQWHHDPRQARAPPTLRDGDVVGLGQHEIAVRESRLAASTSRTRTMICRPLDANAANEEADDDEQEESPARG